MVSEESSDAQVVQTNQREEEEGQHSPVPLSPLPANVSTAMVQPMPQNRGLEEAQDLLSHLQDVLLVLDQVARGKAMTISSLRVSPQVLLRKAKEWAKQACLGDGLSSSMGPSDEVIGAAADQKQAADALRKQIVEKAQQISSRLRKLVLKNDQQQLKPYFKSASLYCLWAKEGNVLERVETRILTSAKIAIELREHGVNDHLECLEAVHSAVGAWDDLDKNATKLRWSRSRLEELSTAVFRSLEVQISVLLERRLDSSSVARCIAQCAEVCQTNPTLLPRMAILGLDAGKRLMRLEQWREALRILQVVGQSIEALNDRRAAIPKEQKQELQTSLLYKLSICYTNLADWDNALTCLSQMESRSDEASASWGPKVLYAKANCWIRKKDFDAVLDCLSKLGEASKGGGGQASFDFARQVALTLGPETDYDQTIIRRAYLLLSTALADDVPKLKVLSLDKVKVVYAALRLSITGESLDHIMDMLTNASTKLLQLMSTPSCAGDTRDDLVAILKNTVFFCFNRQYWLWCSRFCTLLIDCLSSDKYDGDMAKAFCTKTHALLSLGDKRDALKVAKEAHERWPSSATKINLFYTTVQVAEASGGDGDGGDAAIIDLLKYILRDGKGGGGMRASDDILDSFVCLAQMVASTRKEDRWHVLVPILEQWLAEYIDRKHWRRLKRDQQHSSSDGKYKRLKKGGGDDAGDAASLFSTSTTTSSNEIVPPLSVLRVLLQLALKMHIRDQDTSGGLARGYMMESFPPTVFSTAQVEMHRYLTQYCLPLLEAMPDFKQSIGPQGMAKSRDEVIWLITLCWYLGKSSIETKSSLAESFFNMANQLWPLLDEQSLSSQEKQHRVLTLLATLVTSLEGVKAQLTVEEAKGWLDKIRRAKSQVDRALLSDVNTTALGKNLEQTMVVLEVITRCSADTSGGGLEGFLREKYALLQELSVSVLHALARRIVSEPWENRQAGAVLYRLMLKKLMQGSQEDKEMGLWIYVELLKCASDRRDVLKLVHELKTVLTDGALATSSSYDTDPVDRFVAVAYNYGVSLLEVLQPEAEALLSAVLGLLAFAGPLYSDEDSPVRQNMMATYSIALDLKACKMAARDTLFAPTTASAPTTTTTSTTGYDGDDAMEVSEDRPQQEQETPQEEKEVYTPIRGPVRGEEEETHESCPTTTTSNAPMDMEK